MATELVFCGGNRVRVAGTNAEGLILRLNLPATDRVRTPTGVLAKGWVDIETETEGTILVNPVTVAYVRDVD
jgi:hypothetical protein